MAISAGQLDALQKVLAAAGANPFYAPRLRDDSPTAEGFSRLPFTHKSELVADQAVHPPYGTNASCPADAFIRMHQSSGTTTGIPLRWRDTAAGWDWLLDCWQRGLELMQLSRTDRAYFPFSFGPFLGFWSAFEACHRSGLFTVSGGGTTSTARVRAILDHNITVLFATPTYALHLLDVAAAEKLDLATSAVRAVVVAGEPGGCIPATRRRLEAGWGARVFDHYGLTEVGPIAFEPAATPGRLTLLESEYIVEVLVPNSADPAPPETVGELVVTNLGRVQAPVIRYRTGDLVQLASTSSIAAGRQLLGGVIGRADDMIQVRGNNLYPSGLEAIIREVPGVAEYRVEVRRAGAMTDLQIQIEPTPEADGPGVAAHATRAVRDALLFRVEVRLVDPGSLPRFEMKARRIVTIE